MSEILISITIAILCIIIFLNSITNKILIKRIDGLELKIDELDIKVADAKTEMYIKYKELENWVK